jgi:hypothetical protein
MSEALSMALGWPLTKTWTSWTRKSAESEIKVDAARQAVTFTQVTRSRTGEGGGVPCRAHEHHHREHISKRWKSRRAPLNSSWR